MGFWKWAAVGGTAVAIWLVSPLAHAWMAGAALPADNSAICYSCRMAHELAAGALQDRYSNAHPTPGVTSPDKCSPRQYIEEDLAVALEGIDMVKRWRIDRMREAETNQILRETFSNGQLSLLSRCIEDSSLSIACKARVSKAMDTTMKQPRFVESAKQLENEQKKITKQAEAHCERILARSNR